MAMYPVLDKRIDTLGAAFADAGGFLCDSLNCNYADDVHNPLLSCLLSGLCFFQSPISNPQFASLPPNECLVISALF
jgi:hypothetical protein